MIRTAIYNLFVTGERWDPSDLYKIDTPQNNNGKPEGKASKQAVKLLIFQGLLKTGDISVA